ncbi:MAG: GNAT family N-acetyltransferase [Leptolyngbyaceae cyanobacterium MAG.088]|nr:GNAT family N-acetyltransferase [Leptolyngbyaceae cyanobacterium MAG.088]
MIRPTIPDDATALLAIAEAIGFEPDECKVLSEMMADYFSGNSDHIWLTDDEDGPVGVAYCAPERMTNGTWNLLFIAIHPEAQGQGRGTLLIEHVEQLLKEQNVRLLLVETLANFDRTRAFYCKCGYVEEARIRDFYDTGADKIVYRKLLLT